MLPVEDESPLSQKEAEKLAEEISKYEKVGEAIAHPLLCCGCPQCGGSSVSIYTPFNEDDHVRVDYKGFDWKTPYDELYDRLEAEREVKAIRKAMTLAAIANWQRNKLTSS